VYRLKLLAMLGMDVRNGEVWGACGAVLWSSTKVGGEVAGDFWERMVLFTSVHKSPVNLSWDGRCAVSQGGRGDLTSLLGASALGRTKL
jgi:hypothetical protein